MDGEIDGTQTGWYEKWWGRRTDRDKGREKMMRYSDELYIVSWSWLTV